MPSPNHNRISVLGKLANLPESLCHVKIVKALVSVILRFVFAFFPININIFISLILSPYTLFKSECYATP